MSRIKWEKAKAIISSSYKPNREWPHESYFAHCPTDWPQHFAPVHLAHLQAPPIGNDRSHTTAWQASIKSAAGAGELPNVLQPFNLARGVTVPGPADKFGQRHLRWEAQSYTKNLPGIAAEDFRTWLESQGETASEHIAAWFEARCTAPTGSNAPPSLPPLTTSQIAGCFAGFHEWDAAKWKTNLQSPAPWLKACQHQPGNQGKPIVESTWWPVPIALELDNKHINIRRSLHARFKNQEPLKPWFEALAINLPDDS